MLASRQGCSVVASMYMHVSKFNKRLPILTFKLASQVRPVLVSRQGCSVVAFMYMHVSNFKKRLPIFTCK